jgi:hypothetical protein
MGQERCRKVDIPAENIGNVRPGRADEKTAEAKYLQPLLLKSQLYRLIVYD